MTLDVLAGAQRTGNEAAQCISRTDLNEISTAKPGKLAESVRETDWPQYMIGQIIPIRRGFENPAGHVRDERNLRHISLPRGGEVCKGFGGGIHQRGMERMRHHQPTRHNIRRLGALLDPGHGRGLASHDGVRRAVCGGDDNAIDPPA